MYEDDNLLIDSKNDYVYFYYKCQNVDEEIAKSLIKTRLDLFPFPHKGIIDTRNLKWIDMKAIRVLSGPDSYKHFTATVVIVNSKVGKLLGDIYYKLVDAPYPTRLFTNISSSLIWLSKITKEPIPSLNIVGNDEEEFTINPN